jgi:acylphosphatase
MTFARRYLVRGLVQGVGYRYFVFQRAREHGLSGFVQNLPDGRVEVFAEGAAESLDALREELRIGPRFSKVSAVDEVPLAPTGSYDGFTITR